MGDLERFIPNARLREVDTVDVGVPRSKAWEYVRNVDFAHSPIVRALFALRTLPQLVHGKPAETATMRLDDLATNGGNGFQVLAERSGESITLGAIGKVWQPDIDFAVVQPDGFASFAEPGWVKVAWELGCEPRGQAVSRVVIDLRATATDDASWQRFKQYFALVGPFSHLIRRHLLDLAQHELGLPRGAEAHQHLAGDELLADATFDATDGVTIAAPPGSIWPWLVQMGCGRAGWYSWDILDNAGMPSATRINEELQDVHVGDVLPVTPTGKEGFEVLVVDPPHALVLGGLYSAQDGHQLSFTAPRPPDYAHITWAFVLEPLDPARTRLHVRARGAIGPKRLSTPARMFIIGLVHRFMETAQLRNLKARVEEIERSSKVRS